MKYIQLNQGKQTKVDDELFGYLNSFKWHYNGRYVKYSFRVKGKKYDLYMHRLIMCLGDGHKKIVDHINGDKLDNRTCNLRLANKQLNTMNTGLKRTNTSGYKGVCWDKSRRKWQAQIQHNGKFVHAGRFDSKTEAAKAYNEKAKELYGEYAWLNTV